MGSSIRHLEKQKEKEEQKEQIIDSQIEECDKKIFHRHIKKSAKRYNMTQTARIVNTTRQSLYYWIKKGWIRPRRDYRNYPVFTVFDIEEIIKWRNTVK